MKPLILFDMDGTLIIPVKQQEYKGTTTQHTPYLSMKDQMKRIATKNGVPTELVANMDRMALIWNTVRRYAEETKSPEEVAGLMRQINEPFMDHERSDHNLSVLMPDTISALQALKDEGYEMSLVTTAARESYDRLSTSDEYHRFGSFFERSITRDDVNYIKPDPEPLNLMKTLCRRDDVVYVGDSDHDGLAAKASGCKFILINTREYDQETVESLSPDGVIDKLSQLPDILKGLKL